MTTLLFPGQGCQFKGMGKSLFPDYEDVIATADAVLGYSVAELCLINAGGKLGNTRFAQPAIYVVNALSYLRYRAASDCAPDFLVGHSLGEYNALTASGAMDFETGLRLVKKRGELMGKISGGGMVAVVGIDEPTLNAVLQDSDRLDLEIANYNSQQQFVIAGLSEHLASIKPAIEAAGGKHVALAVSGAFHSRRMQPLSAEFATVLADVEFRQPDIPVISNVYAKPHGRSTIRDAMHQQLTRPVRWTESIRYLLERGEANFHEMGERGTLTKLVQDTRGAPPSAPSATHRSPPKPARGERATSHALTPDALGSRAFRAAYSLKYAYAAGSMYKGIASKDLVVRLANAGLLGYFGTGGLKMREIEDAIEAIKSAVGDGRAYGMNLLCDHDRPQSEEDTVDLFIRHGVRDIEAAGYLDITPALARFRLKGLRRDTRGVVEPNNRILAKASRPEVAETFLCPAPSRLVRDLLERGDITEQEALLSEHVPMCDALCAEADSGGHTDRAIMIALLPVFLRMRDELAEKYGYSKAIFVGAAGGIGTPEAAAAAFVLGAEFVLTGSINQCTVEAGNSDRVKDLLQAMDVQDTDYAPAGDLFELGAQIQVLRRGLLFPARAKKLYELYRRHDGVHELDDGTVREIEAKYFGRSFEDVYEETKAYYLRHDPQQIELADQTPKHKMALIFRWYFIHTMRITLRGCEQGRANYQIHCGPALGAFNRWVKGTTLESWRNRHVDLIAEELMHATARVLDERLRSLCRSETSHGRNFARKEAVGSS